jgi:hypothetical protein
VLVAQRGRGRRVEHDDHEQGDAPATNGDEVADSPHHECRRAAVDELLGEQRR